MFHPDSYGYRPGRSALDAVGVCRERCWRSDWVIDLDIRAFFDSVDHELVLQGGTPTHRRAVDPAVCGAVAESPAAAGGRHAACHGIAVPRKARRSHPLLANLFLHYAFDVWMAREFPDVQFERYCDDAVVHCRSEQQAQHVRDAIAARLAQCRSGIASGQDAHRVLQGRESAWLVRAHLVHVPGVHVSAPAGPDEEGEVLLQLHPGHQRRGRQTHGRRSAPGGCTCAVDKTLGDLARMFNTVVQGWINYYGRFYRSALSPPQPHQRLSGAVGMQKYKRFRRRWMRARDAAGQARQAVSRPVRPLANSSAVTDDDWMMGAV